MWKEDDWKFAQTRDHNQSMMWMDPVHVAAIYDFLMHHDFENVVEVGSWDGFSTSAMAQAQLDGKDFVGCCIDVDIRPNLLRVIDGRKITVFRGKSLDGLRNVGNCDCVILDGDHELTTVESEAELLFMNHVQTIIAHDVGRQGAPGPLWLLAKLQATPGWRVWMDDMPREGMATARGLMIATKCPDVYLPDEDNVPHQSKESLIAAALPWSFLDPPRLASLYDLAVEASRLDGNFVECGCARGGSSMILAGVMAKRRPTRRSSSPIRSPAFPNPTSSWIATKVSAATRSPPSKVLQFVP